MKYPGTFWNSQKYNKNVGTYQDGKDCGVTGVRMSNNNGFIISIVAAELQKNEMPIDVLTWNTVTTFYEQLPSSELLFVGTESFARLDDDDTIFYMPYKTIIDENINIPIEYGHYYIPQSYMYKITRKEFNKEFNNHILHYTPQILGEDPKTHKQFAGTRTTRSTSGQTNTQHWKPIQETKNRCITKGLFTNSLISYPNGGSRLTDLDKIIEKNGTFIFNETKTWFNPSGELWFPRAQCSMFQQLNDILPSCIINFIGVPDYNDLDDDDTIYSARYTDILNHTTKTIDLGDNLLLNIADMKKETVAECSSRLRDMLDNPPKKIPLRSELLSPSQYHTTKQSN